MQRVFFSTLVLFAACGGGAEPRVIDFSIDAAGGVFQRGVHLPVGALDARLERYSTLAARPDEDPTAWVLVVNVHPETPYAMLQHLVGEFYRLGVRDLRVVLEI